MPICDIQLSPNDSTIKTINGESKKKRLKTNQIKSIFLQTGKKFSSSTSAGCCSASVQLCSPPP